MEPLTGIRAHKMAAVVFLLSCIKHTLFYRSRLGRRAWYMLVAIVLTFLTGLFCMILEEFHVILTLHWAGPIALVFFWRFVFSNFIKNCGDRLSK